MLFRGICARKARVLSLARLGLAVGALWVLAGVPAQSHAEDRVGLELTPYGGTVIFSDDIGLKSPFLYGGRLGLFPIPQIGIEGNFSRASASVDTDSTGVPDVVFQNYGGDLVWRIAPYGSVVPFLLAGAGKAKYEPDGAPDSLNLNKTSYDVGGGLLFKINRNVGFRFDARDVMHKLEDSSGDEKLQHNFVGTVGIGLLFGGPYPDDDLDGVDNGRDRCPDTPLGALVDKNGCPIDSDGDGVPDGIDQCAATPSGATVDANGCPTDTDGDGVFDGIDQCPGTPQGAVVDARGCPVDSDGDGVADGIDQCPNTPKGATVDATGCPTDADGDGVFDGIDLCPNTPAGARVDKDGCPIEISEIETTMLDTGLIRLSDVNFETARADIKEESHAKLDEVGKILAQWPQLQIEIGGHTDSRGSDTYNQELSESRAKAVLDYLKSKFPEIQDSQYTAVGYGEGQPIEPNNSAANMAKNRRVEFKVLNTDLLKKEVERRRLLQSNEPSGDSGK